MNSIKAFRVHFLPGLLLISGSIYCQESLVGTFYGGWARNTGDYIWTKDLGQDAQMIAVGDVNGDGFDDAIAVTHGKWEVALSETYVDLAKKTVRHFGDKSTWNTGFGSRANVFLVGDINGDAKSDVCAVDIVSGNWGFATSNGRSFEESAIAISGFEKTASHRFLADINTDKLADAIIFASGKWQVAVNNGNGFNAPVEFINEFGTAHSALMMGDVDGDGDADAIHVTNGDAYIALSEGTAFQSPKAWATDLSCSEVLVGDANGDNKSDLILYDEGTWKICPSDGSNAFGEAVFWCRDHGNQTRRLTKCLPAAHKFLVGYTQASKSEKYGVSAIAFNKNYGYWQVMPPLELITSNTPFYYHSWHFHNRAALPLIGDEYYGFDANRDTFAIAELVKQLALAEIDYVLLDQTNPWNALLESYQLFALEISKWNKVPGNRKVKYAIAGMFKRGPEDVEKSAEFTLRDFLNHPLWGGEENYQYWDGKPLLVCYGGANIRRRDLLWEGYSGDKSAAKNFKPGWMDGYISEELIGPEKGDWFGWIMEEGTIQNKDQMVVQPGFYNGGLFISRIYEEIEGDWYRRMNWDKVLLNEPRGVTIISFVGDSEQNDVYTMRTGDYSDEMDKTEFWSYPEMYWEMTRDYIQNYRKLRDGKIERIAEYGKAKVEGNYLTVHFAKPFSKPPVVYVTMEDESGEAQGNIEILDVNENSFFVKLTGGNANMLNFNWLAVMPGSWETTNGMKLAAGKVTTNKNKVKIDLRDHFDNAPALFSMSNSNNNEVAIMTRQLPVSMNSFELSTSPNSKSDKPEEIGWIAVETGKAEMWTGRLCTALKAAIENQKSFEFSLPRYFYDDVLTLVKSSGGDNGKPGAPFVLNTSNLGGLIRYPKGSVPKSDMLNIVCFDGGGGSLYGSGL